MLIRWQLSLILPKSLSGRLADPGESLHLFIGPASAWFTTLFVLRCLVGLDGRRQNRDTCSPPGGQHDCHVVEVVNREYWWRSLNKTLEEQFYHNDKYVVFKKTVSSPPCLSEHSLSVHRFNSLGGFISVIKLWLMSNRAYAKQQKKPHELVVHEVESKQPHIHHVYSLYICC